MVGPAVYPTGARTRAARARRVAVTLFAVGAATGAAGLASARQAIADPSPWSVPAVVGGSARPTGSFPTTAGPAGVEVGFTTAGRGLVSFPGGGVVFPTPPAKPSESLITLAAPIDGDAAGPATQLTPAPVSHVVAVGSDAVLAALIPTGAHARPSVAAGRVGGPLGRAQAIGQQGQTIKALVANARGDVAALLETCAGGGGGCAVHHVFVVVRRAGGAFTKPVALVGRANAMPPGLAIGPTGDVLVAWAAGGFANSRLFARFRFASRRVGPVQTLGAALTEGTISSVLSAGDHAIVAWATAGYGLDGAFTPATFRVAIAGSGGRFGAARMLQRWNMPNTYTPAPIDVASTGDGTGLVAWQGHSATGFDVDVARVDGSRVSPPELSPPGDDATLQGLATSPAGAAIVLWSQDGNLEAGTAMPGEPLAGPEQVAENAGIYGASVAFDPLTARPLVAWYTSDELSVDYSIRSSL
jgi:hypothetical protein